MKDCKGENLVTDNLVELLKESIQDGATTVTYRSVERWDWGALYAAQNAYEVKPGMDRYTDPDYPKTDAFKLETPRVEVQDVVVDGYSDFLDLLESSREYGVDIPGIGTAFYESRYGGEGQGDQYWFVFRLVTADEYARYFKVDGYYASHDGGYYDEMFEVFPKKVEVTEWVQ